ncbi:MAG: hypothetical protein IIX48_07620 [Lachnospiraceae bacterium]|nr:hypothetical protein [Lachnospiraceae bacterium]
MKKMSFKKEAGKQYDESARNLAKRKCTMIYLVVFYILYQAYGIVNSKLMNETTMTWTGVIIGAGILVVGSLTVAVFATIKMGKELAESEITEDAIEADINREADCGRDEETYNEIARRDRNEETYNEHTTTNCREEAETN